MSKIQNNFVPQREKQIQLNWTNNSFLPRLLGILKSEYFESPAFKTEGAIFKVGLCVVDQAENSSKVACFLKRQDQNDQESIRYLIDYKITIHHETWMRSENLWQFRHSETKYIPLMNLDSFKDENTFPHCCRLFVQFCFRICVLKRFARTHFSATTELGLKEASRWFQIPNPYSVRTQHDAAYVSINYISEKLENEMTHRYLSRRNLPDLSIIFRYHTHQNWLIIRCETKLSSVFLKYKIYFLDFKRKMVNQSKVHGNFIPKFTNDVARFIMPGNFIHGMENPESIFEEMRIFLSFSYHKAIFEKNLGSEVVSVSNRSKCCNLKANLQNFYQKNSNKTDFSIRVGESIFHVHSCILAARSPVFRAMLLNDMLESRTGWLNIEDMISGELGILLEFIYSSEITEIIGYQNTSTLYRSADKYGISSLKAACRQKIKNYISLNNFKKLLILSFLHRDVQLKECILLFLASFDWNLVLDGMIKSQQPLNEEDFSYLERNVTLLAAKLRQIND